MGQLKTKPRHLAVVPPAPPFEPYAVTPAAPWWGCPRWCTGTAEECWGGETWIVTPGSSGVTMNRLHEVAVYTTQAVDDTDAGWVKVEVRLERCDFDEDGTPAPADVVLKFTGGDDPDGFGVRLTRAQRRALAAALLNADDLDDTQDAAPAVATA